MGFRYTVETLALGSGGRIVEVWAVTVECEPDARRELLRVLGDIPGRRITHFDLLTESDLRANSIPPGEVRRVDIQYLLPGTAG